MIIESGVNTIEIKSSVMRSLCNFTQLQSSDKEAGGVLMGKVLTNNDFIINVNSEPQEGDTRYRYFFRKNKSKHQKIVDNYWQASKGYINYLGEWHTHPERSPKPSLVDIKSWKSNLQLNENEIFAHVFIIVGTVKFGVWLGVKETKTITNIGYFEL